MERVARKYVRDYERTSRTLASFPKFDKKKFIAVFLFLIMGVAGAVYFGYVSTSEATVEPASPVQAILERQQSLGNVPRKTVDTVTVPDLPADKLSQMAALLVMMEERLSAIKYYEHALAKDPQNAEIFTSLLLNLLARYQYERAFALVDEFASSDSSRVIIWNKIGEYFLLEGRRRDARDAFRNVTIFAKGLPAPSMEIRQHLTNAEVRLSKLH